VERSGTLGSPIRGGVALKERKIGHHLLSEGSRHTKDRLTPQCDGFFRSLQSLARSALIFIGYRLSAIRVSVGHARQRHALDDPFLQAINI
jgi:hypothetical protein